jgi:hypothetical protein
VSGSSAAQPPAPPAPPPASPAPAASAGATLLTDDNVKRFMAWQRSVAGAVTGATLTRGVSQSQVEAAQRVMASSRISQTEITELSTILVPYYGRRRAAVDAAKNVSRGASGLMAGFYQKQIKEGEDLRSALEKQHGKAALAVVDKYEKEYLAIQDLMLKNVTRRRK